MCKLEKVHFMFTLISKEPSIYRVSQKTHFQNATGATVHWLNHHLPAPLVFGDWFFGRFLLRLSRIKGPQVMSMVKFSPIALNFSYDIVLLVHFFVTPCTYLPFRPTLNSWKTHLKVHQPAKENLQANGVLTVSFRQQTNFEEWFHHCNFKWYSYIMCGDQ